jgi:hypothetical protein
MTGFGEIMDSGGEFSTSSLVVGKLYASDYAIPTPTKMTTAISDMETAYTDAAGRPNSATNTNLFVGNLGGQTITPGLYTWSTDVIIPTDVIISGGANDVWIFQIAGNLDINSSTHVVLGGEAKASNIFWQVAGQTTLGTASVFNGNILDQTAVVIKTGAVLNGRALAQTAVTLDANSITLPPISVPTPDLIPPVITITGDNPITVLKNSIYIDQGATATDDIDLIVIVHSSNNVDTSILGTYTVAYKAADTAGNVAIQVYRKVIVVSLIPTITIGSTVAISGTSIDIPITTKDWGNTIGLVDIFIKYDPTLLTINSIIENDISGGIFNKSYSPDLIQLSFTAPAGTAYTLDNGTLATLNFTVISNLNTVTDLSFVEIGAASSTLHDALGGNIKANFVKGVVTINLAPIPDTVIPVITLIGDTSMSLDFGSNFTDPGATAIDDIDGNITPKIITSNPVNTNIAGNYSITYNVADAAGNDAVEVTRLVVVNNPQNGGGGGGGSGGGGHPPFPVIVNPAVVAPVIAVTPVVVGEVLGVSIEKNTCGIYLNSYIKYKSKNNNQVDVRSLQEFLNEESNLNLSIDGTYGQETFNAVKNFQVKYTKDVLTPWGPFGMTDKDTAEGTGYVYKTTQRWINTIKCPELNIPMPDLSL